MTENEEHNNENASGEAKPDEMETTKEERVFDEYDEEDDDELQLMSLLDADASNFHELLGNLWDEAGGGSIIFCDSSEVPEWDVEDLIDSGIIEDTDRIEELLNGGEISQEEVKQFEDHWMENYLSYDTGDATVMELIEVGEKVALLSIPGGNIWTRGEISVRGIFDSHEEALEYLSSIGKYQ